MEKEYSKQDNEFKETLCELKKDFETAMDDDFNTADAISVIFEIVRHSNSYLNADKPLSLINEAKDTITLLCGVLGIICEDEEELPSEDIEKLIEERNAARKERNFARADEIRSELLDKGIILEDTREGVRWKRA